MQQLLGCVCACECTPVPSPPPPCLHTWGWAGEALARNTLLANRSHCERLGKEEELGGPLCFLGELLALHLFPLGHPPHT